jgi:hypothetical protein
MQNAGPRAGVAVNKRYESRRLKKPSPGVKKTGPITGIRIAKKKLLT